MTEMKVFVYGSMVEGLVHFERIKDFVIASEKAHIKALAYRLNVGFPVLVESETAVNYVPGLLLKVKMSDLLLNLLDTFHGYIVNQPLKSLYYRKSDTVFTTGGAEEKADCYFLNPSKLPKNAELILDGDWEKSLQEKPALTEKLTEQQKTYILRLGSCVGREIVPINLNLYRELMNLEMIVDKGRRLALSKKGHEVFRYLS